MFTKQNLENLITAFEIKLPEGGIEFYRVDESRVFPIKGKNGGLTTKLIIYLIQRPKTPKSRIWFKYGIQLDIRDPITKHRDEIDKAIQKFSTLLKSKKSISKFKIDPNGGDLGTGDNK